MRFSIRWLLGMIIFAAVGAAATARPSSWWASGLWTFAIAMLCTSLIGSIVRQGAKRAFWISFAIFGWMYAVLVFAPWFDGRTSSLLLTTMLLSKIGQA